MHQLLWLAHQELKTLILFQAKRAGVNCIILPEENRKDYSDLADFIKEGLEVHFVWHYDEVYKLVFEETTTSVAAVDA